MNYRAARVNAVALAVAFGGLSCSDDGAGAVGAEGTQGGSSATTTGSTAADDPSGGPTTSLTSNGDSTVGTSTGDPMPLPNGENCAANEDCESEKCFLVTGLGGICGECLTDEDCPDGGCSVPNPFSIPARPALCNQGEQGGGCMSDEVCQEGLVCGSLLEVPGLISASTCGECKTDDDCADELLCSPDYDVMDISGSRSCVTVGSLADGTGCDHEGSGEQACMNHCAVANLNNVLELGVCSPCATNEHCDDGMVCAPPQITLDTGLVPGMCVTPR